MFATVLACVVAALVSACGVALLLRNGARLPVAVPNARSLHARAVPRVGGLAIWAGFMPIGIWVAPDLPGGAVGWLPAWILLALVSLLDDARGAPVVLRLAVQLVAAVWTSAWLLRMPGGVLPGVTPGAGYFVAVALSAGVMVWSANLYNFMDGSDGLAGAMTVVGFSALGIAAAGDPALRTTTFALAAAVVPFLVANRPPARLFLGDVGAV